MENTNKHKQDTLRRQGLVLLPAIAYGDVAGLPVETRSAEYIAEHYGTIDQLIPAKENPFYPAAEHPGLWSDDTQLSLAVAKALIKAKEFNMDALAETHYEAYLDTQKAIEDGAILKSGWGKSTSAAMEKLNQGVSPAETGTVGGPGNGVLMKMAPLVYWQIAKGTPIKEMYTQYDQLTTMTHDSELTRAMTRVHGDVLGYLLRTEQFDKKAFISVLHASLASHTFMMNGSNQLFELFSYLDGTVTTEAILANTVDKQTFKAPQTLSRAYGAFLAHDGEFTSSVFEAVNLGGDTDSIASIVGAMSAFATKEPLRMPIDHQNIEKIDMIKRVGRQFVHAAMTE